MNEDTGFTPCKLPFTTETFILIIVCSYSCKEWHEIQGILYSVTLSNIILHNYTAMVTRIWHRHNPFSYSDSPARLVFPVYLNLTNWFYHFLFCRFMSVKFFYITLSMASGFVVLSHYICDISRISLPFFLSQFCLRYVNWLYFQRTRFLLH